MLRSIRSTALGVLLSSLGGGLLGCGPAPDDSVEESLAETSEAVLGCPDEPLHWDFLPWPNGTVWYRLSDYAWVDEDGDQVNDPVYTYRPWNAAKRAVLQAAMDQWTHVTDDHVIFTEWPLAGDELEITLGTANHSGIGYSPWGGHWLAMGPDGGGSATAKHDMGHAIGMGHVHVRSDRDRYVTVDVSAWGDEPPCGNVQLAESTSSTDYGVYDTQSIMHYDSTNDFVLHRDDGSDWDWTNQTPVTPQDGSNLLEWDAQYNRRWQHFRPLGLHSSWTSRLNNKLASGVTVASTPALTSQYDGWLNLFVRGSNGRVYHRFCVGGCSTAEIHKNRLTHWFPASGWDPLPQDAAPEFSGAPSAASMEVGKVDVVILGTDGNIWRKAYVAPSFTAWSSALGKPSGVTIQSSPSLISNGPGNLEVFVRGTNGNFYSKVPGGSWSSAITPPAGVTLGGDPAVIATSATTVELFSNSSTGEVYVRKRISGTWQGSWNGIGSGAKPNAGIAVASTASGRVHVFGKSTSNRVLQKTRPSFGASFAAWVKLGGEIGTGGIAADGYKNHIDLAIIGPEYAHAEADKGVRYRSWPRRGRVKGDFDGDGRGDLALFRPSTSTWHIAPSTGAPAYEVDFPNGNLAGVPEDFDFDGRTDPVVFRASDGLWTMRRSTDGDQTGWWGAVGDRLLAGDFSGDGRADFALYRPWDDLWWIRPSDGSPNFTVSHGNDNDVMVPADYDGDFQTDIALYRPQVGRWYIVPSSTRVEYYVVFGAADYEVGVPGDYDGDGKWDPGVFQRSTGTWHMMFSSTGEVVTKITFVSAQDQPVPKDYDGDGRTDPAVFTPSSGSWKVFPTDGSTPYTTQFGESTDQPF